MTMISQANASTLTLAVAQSTAVLRDVEQNVSRHIQLASLAAAHGARLVLFPELSLTGYDWGLTAADALSSGDARLRRLHDMANAAETVVVAGAPLLSRHGLHIGAIAFGLRDGVDTYTKQFVTEGEARAFVSGIGRDPLPIGDQFIGLAICADATHPEHARDAVRRRATIYAACSLITAGGYAADTALLQRYALDYRMLVLMANYGAPVGEWAPAGKSAIWSEHGELLACAPAVGEALVVAQRHEDCWNAKVVECPT